MAKVIAVCISPRKGMRKVDIGSARAIEEFGLEGDAHAGKWHRQVSLLSVSSIDKMRAKGLSVGPGDFAENITVEGLDFLSCPLGTRFTVGPSVILELTQIGKKCHAGCAIMKLAGDCVMPKEGIFARVICGGVVNRGDKVQAMTAQDQRVQETHAL